MNKLWWPEGWIVVSSIASTISVMVEDDNFAVPGSSLSHGKTSKLLFLLYLFIIYKWLPQMIVTYFHLSFFLTHAIFCSNLIQFVVSLLWFCSFVILPLTFFPSTLFLPSLLHTSFTLPFPHLKSFWVYAVLTCGILQRPQIFIIPPASNLYWSFLSRPNLPCTLIFPVMAVSVLVCHCQAVPPLKCLFAGFFDFSCQAEFPFTTLNEQ